MPRIHTIRKSKGRTSKRAEAEWLAQYDPSAFEHPSVAVDIVVLTVRDRALEALLFQRTEHPFQDAWTLPGGFVGIDESLDDAARRVVADKGGLEGIFLEQLYTFGDPHRDPRTRVISVAYMALVEPSRAKGAAQFRTLRVPWAGETGGPVDALDDKSKRKALPLGFDHATILGTAVKRIRGKLDYTPIGFQLLPERFTLRLLQDVHETVLGRTLNKDSFRRRMLQSGELEATGAYEDEVVHRPAELYRFARRSAV